MSPQNMAAGYASGMAVGSANASGGTGNVMMNRGSMVPGIGASGMRPVGHMNMNMPYGAAPAGQPVQNSYPYGNSASMAGHQYYQTQQPQQQQQQQQQQVCRRCSAVKYVYP